MIPFDFINITSQRYRKIIFQNFLIFLTPNFDAIIISILIPIILTKNSFKHLT